MGAWEHENMGGMIRMDDMERLERIEDEKLEMGVVNEGELEEGRRKKRPNKEYRDMLNRLSRTGSWNQKNGGGGCLLYRYSGAGGCD